MGRLTSRLGRGRAVVAVIGRAVVGVVERAFVAVIGRAVVAVSSRANGARIAVNFIFAEADVKRGMEYVCRVGVDLERDTEM